MWLFTQAVTAIQYLHSPSKCIVWLVFGDVTLDMEYRKDKYPLSSHSQFATICFVNYIDTGGYRNTFKNMELII
ncbi:MAG: hypothetical protein ACI9DH_001212 [Halioglobus sp.]